MKCPNCREKGNLCSWFRHKIRSQAAWLVLLPLPQALPAVLGGAEGSQELGSKTAKGKVCAQPCWVLQPGEVFESPPVLLAVNAASDPSCSQAAKS